jgi:hypothetical protein
LSAIAQTPVMLLTRRWRRYRSRPPTKARASSARSSPPSPSFWATNHLSAASHKLSPPLARESVSKLLLFCAPSRAASVPATSACQG